MRIGIQYKIEERRRVKVKEREMSSEVFEEIVSYESASQVTRAREILVAKVMSLR